MEEVAAAGDGPKWYQLYWPAERDLAASFVSRAERAGYAAIVVTLDTWQLGWRPRDLKTAYLPFLQSIGIANYLSDPVFKADLDKIYKEQDIIALSREFYQGIGLPIDLVIEKTGNDFKPRYARFRISRFNDSRF